MTRDQLENILAVLEQARMDREVVNGEFRTRGDPISADTSDIDNAITAIEAELLIEDGKRKP